MNSKRSEESRFGERSEPVLKTFASAVLVIFCSIVLVGAFSAVYAQLSGGGNMNWGGGEIPWGGGQGGSWSVGNFVKANSFTELINRIAGWIFTLAMPIAIIAFVWAGILFMIAGGDEQKITTAKKAMTWSVVGLVIALLGRNFSALIEDLLGGQVSTAQGVINAFNRIANYFSGFAIALAIMVFIYAGILFLTSSGDESKITKAKKAFFWGIVGTAIAISAQAIYYIVRSILKV